jgi:hypothetical protein
MLVVLLVQFVLLPHQAQAQRHTSGRRQVHLRVRVAGRWVLFTLGINTTRLTGHRFVFCRQRYDSSLKRGGEQSSVVVLSQLPFTSVLRPLSQITGPLYFNEGPAALERVWPPTSPQRPA